MYIRKNSVSSLVTSGIIASIAIRDKYCLFEQPFAMRPMCQTLCEYM